MAEPRLRHYLWLHFVVFIWGWTGILGKVIGMVVVPMIWSRMVLTVLILLMVMAIRRTPLRMPARDRLQLLAVGGLIALHWIFFYQTIKISTVSIAVICLSTSTFFNALLDPLISKRPIQPYELIISLVVVLAICFIFNFQPGYHLGMIYGVISAFFSAAFTTFNGKLSRRFEPLAFSVTELTGGVVLLTLFMAFDPSWFGALGSAPASDWWYLFVLASVCTALPFVASAYVLRHLPSFTVILAINLEPVYTILLARWIFGDAERMNLPFYIGTGVILLTLFFNAWAKRKSLVPSTTQSL
jgi:drug/metabolite transporter (DMT)-like permease